MVLNFLKKRAIFLFRLFFLLFNIFLNTKEGKTFPKIYFGKWTKLNPSYRMTEKFTSYGETLKYYGNKVFKTFTETINYKK
jgi:hypothetical protein